jgi:hypothetical protein
MSKLCIGLFGTCGRSTWRQNLFIPKYLECELKDGIDFFNPQVENWNPALAEIEAEHLAEDSIICFPITSETYAFGSLAEIGFSILQSLKFDDRRDLIIMIDPILDPNLMKDEDKAKESLRSRALVKQHLKKLRYNNLYLVDTLQEILDLSLLLYDNQKRILKYQNKFNPHKKTK